jgi:YfiH family protein
VTAPEPPLIRPDWPAPARVRAVSTTRLGGVSTGPWTSLNLGARTDDEPDHVAENRRRLASASGCPPPAWLAQVHGRNVVELELPPAAAGPQPEADASVTGRPGVACVVLSADCLPVLFCDRAGTRVAAAHAGWRGLAAGVLEATLERLGAAPAETLAWLGPCIGPAAFEVGPEVRRAFLETDAGAAAAFVRGRGDRWHADLRGLARRRLAAAGVHRVGASDACTASEPGRFFSHRRDGPCGRMATLIWLAD